MRFVISCAVVALWAAVSSARADPILFVKQGDPAMNAAFRKARATLGDFLNKVRNPPAGVTGFTVKVGLADNGRGGFTVVRPGQKGDVEYFWLNALTLSGRSISGVLSGTPGIVTTVTEGQSITAVLGNIADWSYVDQGVKKGEFTLCPALAHAGDDLRVRFGARCGW